MPLDCCFGGMVANVYTLRAALSGAACGAGDSLREFGIVEFEKLKCASAKGGL